MITILGCLFIGLLNFVISGSLDFLHYYETANITIKSREPVRTVRSVAGSTRPPATYRVQLFAFHHQFSLELNRRDLFSEKPILCVVEKRGGCVEDELNITSYLQGVLLGKYTLLLTCLIRL